MTDTPKWTPGPWEAFIDDSGTGRWAGWPLGIHSVDDEDKTVVRTGGSYPYDWGTATSQDEAIANAHLIAAAPDLYEALVEARNELRIVTEELYGEDHNSPQINDALAKARGDDNG